MRSLVFLFKEFWSGLALNRYLHFTHGMQVTGSLIVMGVFFVFLVWAFVFWEKLGSGLEIHVFLDDNLSAKQKIRVEEDLLAIQHVKSAVYRSKEEALKVFGEMQTGIPIDDLWEENPLPDSYLLQAAKPSYINEIAGNCEVLSGVMSVRYGQEIVDKYLKILLVVGLVCGVTFILLVLFTFSSINNIIGMSIYARRTEIRIMQLVGATWWFIRWPFLFEGMFIGAVGALFASMVVWAILAVISGAMKGWQLDMVLPAFGIDQRGIYLGMAFLLLSLGVTVGFSGSLRTVNSYLRKESQISLDFAKVRQLGRR